MIICIMGAYLGFSDFMCLNSESIETAWFWIKVSSLWPLIVSLVLHFAILFSNNEKYLRNKLVYLLLYAPPLFFIITRITTDLIVAGVKKEPWGYTYIPAGSWVTTIMAIWAPVISTLSLLLCANHYLRTTDYKQKQQAKYIVIGFSFPIIAALISTAILPRFSISIPGLSPLGSSIMAVFIGLAIWKYRLFTITPSAAAEKIISTMKDPLFIAELNGDIVTVNEAILTLLGYSEDELVSQPVSILFPEKEALSERTGFEKIVKERSISNSMMSYRTKGGDRIPVSLTVSILNNAEGKETGIIGVARDMRYELEFQQKEKKLAEAAAEEKAKLESTKKSKEEIEKKNVELKSIAEELEKAKSGMEEKVKERTRELEKSRDSLQSKVKELEHFTELTIDREERLAELKAELDEIKKNR